MFQTSAIAEALQSVDLAPAQPFRNLTVFPLIARSERTPDYVTLDEALAGDAVRITEVSEAGTVPELSLRNDGPSRVLLLDGEELIGAKQNRVLNLTILVPAVSDVRIPVSCVESGRWHHVSRNFSAAPRAQFAEGRAAKMRTVTESMRREGSRRSDQGQVWEAIAMKASRLDSDSATGAMSAVFEQHEASVGSFVDACPALPGQAGAIFAINGRIVGLELFDAPATWRKLAPKLVRSYALDAVDRAGEAASPLADEARAFMTAVAAVEPSGFPSTGIGIDVRLSSPHFNGAALVVDDHAVHLSAFASEM